MRTGPVLRFLLTGLRISTAHSLLKFVSHKNRVWTLPTEYVGARNPPGLRRPRCGKLESDLARKNSAQNGHNRLDEAMALLLQNQVTFVTRLAETDSRLAENQRQHLEFERETAERFARIEAQMAEIIRVLNEHGQLLEHLPELIREKIGFKGQP